MCLAPSPRSGPYPPLQPEKQDPSKTRWTTDRQKRPARPFANWVPCNRLYPELQEAETEGTKRQRYALTVRITGFTPHSSANSSGVKCFSAATAGFWGRSGPTGNSFQVGFTFGFQFKIFSDLSRSLYNSGIAVVVLAGEFGSFSWEHFVTERFGLPRKELHRHFACMNRHFPVQDSKQQSIC